MQFWYVSIKATYPTLDSNLQQPMIDFNTVNRFAGTIF